MGGGGRWGFVPELQKHFPLVQTAPMQESVNDNQRKFKCNWRKTTLNCKTVYEKLPLRYSGIGEGRGCTSERQKLKSKVLGRKGKIYLHRGRGVNLCIGSETNHPVRVLLSL